MRIILIIAFVSGLTASAAADSPPVPAKVKKPRASGTFFLVEGQTGPAFGVGFAEGGVGLGTRFSLGVGGGFKGVLPRFYLLFSTRYTTLGATVTRGTLVSEIDRDMWDISGGLRVLIPIPALRRLRFLVELQLGSSLLDSSAQVNGLETFKTDDQRFTVYLAGGVQYRFHRHVSAGIMVEGAMPTERAGADFIAQVSRLDDPGTMMGWVAASATLVAHF